MIDRPAISARASFNSPDCPTSPRTGSAPPLPAGCRRPRTWCCRAFHRSLSRASAGSTAAASTISRPARWRPMMCGHPIPISPSAYSPAAISRRRWWRASLPFRPACWSLPSRRGLDVSAAAFVHAELVRERGNGCAILLISDDLAEIFELSDRIVAMYEGTIVCDLERQAATLSAIGLAISGVGPAVSAAP